MYADDTFFHLSLAARIGLAALSGALALVTLALAAWIARRLSKLPGRWRLVSALGIGLGLLWLFVWLSPQVYYTYYRFVFPGLPNQIVVQWPPGPLRLAEILSFTGKRTLSEHSKSLLGWLLIVLALRSTRNRSAEK